jgi:putative transcriptional regulator
VNWHTSRVAESSGGDEDGADGASSSLVHHLLCAVPQLLDPNFRRSVVFMLEHDARGALGLVLNNPAANAMDEVARGLGLHWRGSDDARVRVGGPVEPVKGWILHDDDDWDPVAQTVLPGVWLTTTLDQVVKAGHLDMGAGDHHILFMLGYAGWAPQQLEGEIAAGGWIAVPVRAADEGPGVAPSWLFETPAETMWDEALRAIGVDPGRLHGLQASRVGLA